MTSWWKQIDPTIRAIMVTAVASVLGGGVGSAGFLKYGDPAVGITKAEVQSAVSEALKTDTLSDREAEEVRAMLQRESPYVVERLEIKRRLDTIETVTTKTNELTMQLLREVARVAPNH